MTIVLNIRLAPLNRTIAPETDGSSSDEYEDEDRIPCEELEKRCEKIIPVSSWYESCF
jgi:hypothetical protein